MKKYIIAVLWLVAVWGCSDDKVTTPVGNEFPLIESIIILATQGGLNDTVGNIAKYGELCNKDDDDDIIAPWNFKANQFEIEFRVKTQQEVRIVLETAEGSQELKDSILVRYNSKVLNHEKYWSSTIKTVVLEQGQHTIIMKTEEYNKGFYLIKVIREDVGERCFPIIVEKREVVEIE